MKRNPAREVAIEEHCDERGTAEYNLALGERRSVGVTTRLALCAIPVDRVRTVSDGKEFPFVPGHNEEAWNQNRRARFVSTAEEVGLRP
jgi:peptidoglycan-associated lipoprotein